MNPPGPIGWVDLTVPDAARIRDFYQAVAGWSVQEVSMTDAGENYADYAMLAPSTGKAVSGVCWRRGANKDVPAGWMIYITVENLEASLAKCLELGGKLLPGRTPTHAFIEDPSGARCALFQA